MIATIFHIVEVALWSGIAALGFGILFNIPKSAIVTVFFLGFCAGLVKFVALHFSVNIVLSSFLAATTVGVFSVPLAHRIHQPPVIFSIPAVIPMIPGYFAYKTVLLVMQFTTLEKEPSKRIQLIDEILSNGFSMFFILISLTIGVLFPMLLLRKNTIKHVK